MYRKRYQNLTRFGEVVAISLFNKKEKALWWICAVAKSLNDEGFLITTYPTDAIKESEILWTK